MNYENYNRALKFSTSKTVETFLNLLANNPESRQPGHTDRLVAADAIEDAIDNGVHPESDRKFAHYLRSPHVLAVDHNNRILRSSLPLHRILSEIDRRRTQRWSYPGNDQDEIREQAAKQLESHGRHHEADIMRNHDEYVRYRDGVVRGTHDSHEYGGVPILYTTWDGGLLCPECRNGGNGSLSMSNTNDPQWRIGGAIAHEEGPPIQCDHCNRQIESLFGDPNEPDEDR